MEREVVFSVPQQAERLETLKRLGQEIFVENSVLNQLIRANKRKEAVQRFNQGKVLSLVEQSEEILQALNTTEDKLQQQRQSVGDAAMQSLVLFIKRLKKCRC